MSRRRLLLVNPVQMLHGRRQQGWNGIRFVPPLSLAYVAAQTPADWEIRIVDENAGEDATRLPDYRPDLVGITSYTATIPRAYELAAFFRRGGTTVVIGGCHATVEPQEVTRYADAAFVGQAEGAWQPLLDDLRHDRLRPVYDGGMPPLDGLALPGRHLYPHRYLFDAMLTSKGCPYNCEFCSVWKAYERCYLVRPVDEVLDELAQVRARHLFFVDDNFAANRGRTIDLCRGMVERRLDKRFAIQASLDVGLDDEVLDWLRQAGCFMISVGLESLDENTLRQIRKSTNLRVGTARFREAVARIQARGMAVSGSIIFGHDGDTIDTFDHLQVFARESGLDSVVHTILTPLPGTDLRTRLRAEGRLLEPPLPDGYAYYDAHHALFRPAHMTAAELQAANHQAVTRWTRSTTLLAGLWRTWRRTGSPLAALAAFQNNRWARINAQCATDRGVSWPAPQVGA